MLLLLFPIPLEQESLHQVKAYTFPRNSLTRADFTLHTTVAEMPQQSEDEQKQGESRDRRKEFPYGLRQWNWSQGDHIPYQPAHQQLRSQPHPYVMESTGDILVSSDQA
ncbi:hypothetical protein TNCV_733981 [Trichonephila clavipes]|nr:hypothetical protein TNCV_733981 [Trichonephila clavipes]